MAKYNEGTFGRFVEEYDNEGAVENLLSKNVQSSDPFHSGVRETLSRLLSNSVFAKSREHGGFVPNGDEIVSQVADAGLKAMRPVLLKWLAIGRLENIAQVDFSLINRCVELMTPATHLNAIQTVLSSGVDTEELADGKPLAKALSGGSNSAGILAILEE